MSSSDENSDSGTTNCMMIYYMTMGIMHSHLNPNIQKMKSRNDWWLTYSKEKLMLRMYTSPPPSSTMIGVNVRTAFIWTIRLNAYAVKRLQKYFSEKLANKKCITLTDGFRDVCLNKNVLEAALGSWREMTEEPIEISNKSYRFIAYRQYISWVFGWLGKDVRKVIPSCAVDIIRKTFPAADNIYVPYKESPCV